MLSLQELRRIDPAIGNLSDPQLRRLRAKLYALGELAFDISADKQQSRNGVSKNPVGVVTLPKGNITM
jgi:hypothetical protein